MATLKSVFPTWINMWSGYKANYLDIIGENFTKSLGSRAIHQLVLNSVYNYWKNDEFEDDEESSVDKIMTMIRAKAVRLAQNQLLYKNIYETLKIPAKNYQELREVIKADLAPFYRKNTYAGQSIVKSGNIQHQGLAYGSQTSERINKPQQTTTSIGGTKRQINQTTLQKQYLIDKNWIPRLLNNFSQSGIDLQAIIQEFHPFFCSIYPFEEGKFSWDEEVKDYKWKSKRSEEEIEIDPKTGKPLDDEALRDISKEEYDKMKEEGKDVKPTWYLEGTYRFLGRLNQELKKKAQQSKLKQEERIEACEKLIKIYEKTYERPTIDFFFKTLEEQEGYEEYKNIVGNYFVNLLDPTDVPIRPMSFILVGPPGTGKSAIAKLTAKASNRAYISIPMNGVDEPTYLKGREIAYGGADQGKLLKEMLNKGSSQPIVLIDELTRAKGKAITDIIGTMTDPDQNAYSFEDDWLKWKLDLSQAVFIIADNHIEKIDPFLISRSSVVNISILTYQKRVALVKKVTNKTLSNDRKTRAYANTITNDFCKYLITEEWGVRQSLANISNLFLGLRASVSLKNPINNFNNPTKVEKNETSFVLTYEKGQKITLVRCKSEDKGLDGINHSVFTDVPDWPGATPHDEKKEKTQITILDLSFQGLYTFDFTRYPELKTLDISNNEFTGLDLSKNSKLKSLNLFSNLELNFSDIDFGESKKSLEEINFSLIEDSQIINLRGFSKLKRITYDWKVSAIYLDKNYENKIRLNYPRWQDLHSEEKIEFQAEYEDNKYDAVMGSKVIFEEI